MYVYLILKYFNTTWIQKRVKNSHTHFWAWETGSYDPL